MRIPLILERKTGCFEPGCKLNVESNDVLLPFRPMAEYSRQPLRGWKLTPAVQSQGKPPPLPIEARHAFQEVLRSGFLDSHAKLRH